MTAKPESCRHLSSSVDTSAVCFYSVKVLNNRYGCSLKKNVPIILNCNLFVLQVSEALQGDEDKGVAELVPTNPEGPTLPPHQGSSHHSPGP